MGKVKKKKISIIVISIVLFLLILRLLLPYLVLGYANRSLAEMKGYYGHVQDIDISLYRGAYQLDSIYIHKLDTANGHQTPFFSAQTIDLSVEWKAILKGRLVGELVLESPRVVFTKERAEIGQVVRDSSDFRKILKDFMPLQVNRFEVRKGSVHYTDSSASPVVDISLTDAYILALDLRNTEDKKVKLPSTIVARAKAYDGNLSLNMKLNALAQQPTFDLNAKIEHADLPKLNDFFIAYAKFDISKGTFGLYSEFAADGGRYTGYVKPVITGLQVKGIEDKKDSFLQKVKETVIDVVGDILKNPKKEQVATVIPVKGSFGKTTVGTWHAVWEVLKNAFIEALLPSVDNVINISSPSEGEKIGLERYKTSDNHSN